MKQLIELRCKNCCRFFTINKQNKRKYVLKGFCSKRCETINNEMKNTKYCKICNKTFIKNNKRIYTLNGLCSLNCKKLNDVKQQQLTFEELIQVKNILNEYLFFQQKKKENTSKSQKMEHKIINRNISVSNELINSIIKKTKKVKKE